MPGKNKIVTIMLLFVMGVDKGKPLKCFQSIYAAAGLHLSVEACKELKQSDTESEYLKSCPASTKSCSVTRASGTLGDKPNTVLRSCGNEDRAHCRDLDGNDLEGLVGGIGKECYCKEDGCNKAPGGTLSDTLMTLCLSWDVQQNFHFLFWKCILDLLLT